MIKSIIVSLLAVACNAGGGGYGGSGSAGGATYGGGVINFGTNSLGSGAPGGPIPAAIQSTHTVEIQTVSVPQTPIQPQIVEVDANVLPLTIHFKSASSNLNVFQTHQGSEPGEVQQTSSEDEPHHLIHEVTKPIIQEVREVITPFRRVIQEVKPVQEEIQTIVSRGEGRASNFGNIGFNFGSGGAINTGGAISTGGYNTGVVSGGAISGGGVSILSPSEATKAIGSSKSSGSSALGSTPLSRYIGDASSKSSSKDYSSS